MCTETPTSLYQPPSTAPPPPAPPPPVYELPTPATALSRPLPPRPPPQVYGDADEFADEDFLYHLKHCVLSASGRARLPFSSNTVFYMQGFRFPFHVSEGGWGLGSGVWGF